MIKSDITAQEWKEKGNEEYNKGNWSKALSHYTKALNLIQEDNDEKAMYYKNRAAVYLKLHDYEKVIKDCDTVLKICYNDPKALFRRCQALEALERFEEAYHDATNVLFSDPNNKLVQSVATRLYKIKEERHKEKARISAKVSQILDLALNMNANKEKHETAMKDLLVLAREETGAEEIFKKEGLSRIAQLVKVEKNEEVTCNAIRIVGELCKNNISRTESIMKDIDWYLEIMNSASTERVIAVQCCLQNILNTYSGMKNRLDSTPDKALCEAHTKEINMILSNLLNNITSRTITGLGRDAIIQFIIHNICCATSDSTEQLIELRGLQGLMELASEVEEYKYESSMDITSSTQTKISMCLAKIYNNMDSDAAKEKFSNTIDEFIKNKLALDDLESKVRVVVAATILLLGPFDVGNAIVAKYGILELILGMVETDDVLQQKVACEFINAAMTKKDKNNAITNQGVNILKKLYQSKNDSIQIRALVGLCILDSSEAIDVIGLLTNRMAKKMTDICIRFLNNRGKEKGMIKWALKGLMYLTCDAEVKEKLVKNQQAVKAMIELTKTGDEPIFYGIIMTLVNLCNAYDEQELIPEMIQLAKFSRHYVFKKHKLNNVEFVGKRSSALIKAGITSALVRLAITDSQNRKELIARIFYAMFSQLNNYVPDIVIQQGGTKVLLSLALEGTDKGKKKASLALTYLIRNPEYAFPDQSIMKVVRPFVSLLNSEYSFSENLKGLKALAIMTSVNDSMRKLTAKEGFQEIKAYIYNHSHPLRRISIIIMQNLVDCEEIISQYFEQDDQIIERFVELCINDDQLVEITSVILAILSRSKKSCEKIFATEDWLKALCNLLVGPSGVTHFLGIEILMNMMISSKDAAAKILESELLKLVMVCIITDSLEYPIIKRLAIFAIQLLQNNK